MQGNCCRFFFSNRLKFNFNFFPSHVHAQFLEVLMHVHVHLNVMEISSVIVNEDILDKDANNVLQDMLEIQCRQQAVNQHHHHHHIVIHLELKEFFQTDAVNVNQMLSDNNVIDAQHKHSISIADLAVLIASVWESQQIVQVHHISETQFVHHSQHQQSVNSHLFLDMKTQFQSHNNCVLKIEKLLTDNLLPMMTSKLITGACHQRSWAI